MKLHEDADYKLHHTSIILLLELVLYKIFDEGMGDQVYHDLKRMRQEYAQDSHEYALIGNLIEAPHEVVLSRLSWKNFPGR